MEWSEVADILLCWSRERGWMGQFFFEREEGRGEGRWVWWVWWVMCVICVICVMRGLLGRSGVVGVSVGDIWDNIYPLSLAHTRSVILSWSFLGWVGGRSAVKERERGDGRKYNSYLWRRKQFD